WALGVLAIFSRRNIDSNTAMSQVSSLAISDLYYLPPGTIPPMVMPFDPTATLPLALLSVSSPVFDETRLYDVAYFDLRNRLQGISGVIAPAVYLGRDRDGGLWLPYSPDSRLRGPRPAGEPTAFADGCSPDAPGFQHDDSHRQRQNRRLRLSGKRERDGPQSGSDGPVSDQAG